MSKVELMDVITDIDEKYIEKAFIAQDDLQKFENEKKTSAYHRKKMYVAAACIALLICVVLSVFVTHWFLQREERSTEKESKSNEIYSQSMLTPTHYTGEESPSWSIKELPIVDTYQFLLWGNEEYIASWESSDRIGAELGTARVLNHEKVTNTTLLKDVIVYEYVGMDSGLAVIVYYPEEQEYYVYYNAK